MKHEENFLILDEYCSDNLSNVDDQDEAVEKEGSVDHQMEETGGRSRSIGNVSKPQEI